MNFLRGANGRHETGELSGISTRMDGQRRRLRQQVLARLQAVIEKGVRFGNDYITLGTEQCLSC